MANEFVIKNGFISKGNGSVEGTLSSTIISGTTYLNLPSVTGITGSGSVSQIPYFDTSSTLTGTTNLTYSGGTLQIRALSETSTDIPFRIRNSADTVNSVEYNGNGSKYWRAHTGDMHFMFDPFNNQLHLKRTGQYIIQTDNAVTSLLINCNVGDLSLRGGSKALYIYNGGNFHLGGTALLAGSGDGNLIFQNGTPPSTNQIDRHYYYSADITAGNAAPHFRTENGSIVKLYQETTGVTSSTYTSVGGSTIQTNDTFDGYTIPQIVKALKNLGILS